MSELVTIRTRAGVPFTVAKDAAPKFEALLNDLEASGYPIRGDQSGGYNYRTIAGTNTLSNHAHGNAVDVNWSENARGTAGNIPPGLARDLAAKHGMTWGGDWKNPDPMHFEIAGAHGGHAPEAPQQIASKEQTPMWDTLIASLLGGGDVAKMATKVGVTGGEAAQPTPTFGSLGGGLDRSKAQDALASAAQQQAAMGSTQAAQPYPDAPQQQRPMDLSRLRQVIAQRPVYGIGRSIV